MQALLVFRIAPRINPETMSGSIDDPSGLDLFSRQGVILTVPGLALLAGLILSETIGRKTSAQGTENEFVSDAQPDLIGRFSSRGLHLVTSKLLAIIECGLAPACFGVTQTDRPPSRRD